MKFLPFFALLLCSCVTTQKPVHHTAVTAPTQTSITRAAEASHEAQAASERSSVHIKALRTSAQRISDEAGKAIRLLDHP
jgi:hypothetical protein